MILNNLLLPHLYRRMRKIILMERQDLCENFKREPFWDWTIFYNNRTSNYVQYLKDFSAGITLEIVNFEICK